jgi:hypothetical protein
MISLGREPQGWGKKMRDKPRSGDRFIAPTPAAYAAAENLSPPSGASRSCDAWYLGLTPRLYIYRASGAQIGGSFLIHHRGVSSSVSPEESRVGR